MLFFVLVFFGSALGGMTRHLVGGWIARRLGPRFPWGTLVVNVTGAFLIGVIWAAPWASSASSGGEHLVLFLTYGFLGGYTTVSSFTLQTFTLMQAGQWRSAGVNVAASYGLCLAAVYAGASLFPTA